MHEPLLESSKKKARLLGSCVEELLDVLHAGTSTKKNQPNNFLDSLEICRLRQQQCHPRPTALVLWQCLQHRRAGLVSGPCSPGRAFLPSKRGPCCRMRHLFITRESKLSIDPSCCSLRRDEAGAGCSLGHE